MKQLSFSRLILLASAWSLMWLGPPEVQAQTADCTQELQDAETAYLNGDFEQATELLQTCSERDLPQNQREQVYRLMGITYLADNLEEQARTAIMQLLELVPNYEPNPVQDHAAFIRMVEEVKTEMQAAEAVAQTPEETQPTTRQPERRKKRGIGKWLALGGVLAAGGVAAAVLLPVDGGGGGGGTETGPIAAPPPLPGGN